MVLRLDTPEEGNLVAADRRMRSDRQHADHRVRADVALFERIGIETVVGPVKRAPQRAVLQLVRARRMDRVTAQFRSRPTGIDHEVEWTGRLAVAIYDRNLVTGNRHILNINIRNDLDAAGLRPGIQHVEQRRAMHGEPVIVITQNAVVDIEDLPSRRHGHTVNAVDTLAQRVDLGMQAEVFKDGKSGRLQDNSRADRSRRFKALKQCDVVALFREHDCCAESRRTASCDCDSQSCPSCTGVMLICYANANTRLL